MATAVKMTEAPRMINDDELEQNWAAEGVVIDEDDDDVVSLGSEDELDDDEDDVGPAVMKRSRDDDAGDQVREDGSDDDKAMGDGSEKPAAKKQKKEKPSKGLHKMTVAEHFRIVNDVLTKHKGGQMTTLELAEGLNESHFVAPDGLGKHTLPNLGLYMRHLQPQWKKNFRNRDWRYDKSPCFLIICSSALRAVELLKHFGSFQCKVAKLFAKHMKVQDQADQLERMFLPIAVGTPSRIKVLLEMKALSLEHTRHVILDMEKDKKSMTILELNDTAKDMLDLVQYHFLPLLNKQKLKLVLY